MNVLLEGIKASNISFKRYQQLRAKMDLPKIPEMAFDISYIYRFDGYLPVFLFNLIYKVPLSKKISVYELKNNGLVRLQNFVEEKQCKLVKYTEFQE